MFQFTEVDVPVQTRSATPNPFLDVVRLMDVNGKAQQIVVAGHADKVPSKSGKTQSWGDPEISRLMRQLTEAGNAENVTVRRKLVDNQTGEVTVTFWLVEKIVRKGDETDDDSDENYDDDEM